MIYGIGIDVVEPQRVAHLLEKYGERFARRVLTQREWPGYARTVNPVSSGFFPCAKIAWLSPPCARKELVQTR